MKFPPLLVYVWVQFSQITISLPVEIKVAGVAELKEVLPELSRSKVVAGDKLPRSVEVGPLSD